MLERLLQWTPFKKTVLTGISALILGVGSLNCGDTQVSQRDGGTCTKQIYFEDKDRDGKGNKDRFELFCEGEQPDNYVSELGDCDDNNPNVHQRKNCNYDGDSCGDYQLCVKECPIPPEEICDSLDNNCNDLIDENLTRVCYTDWGEGKEVCINGSWQNCDAPQPQGEVCQWLKVRINFLEFSADRLSAAGNDYLFDVEIKSEENEDCRAQGRTGHSRYIQPEYLDLNLPKICSGELTKVNIFAYWHLSDILIDIDPERSHGRCLRTSVVDPEGCYLTLDYEIGSTLEGQVDGNDDGFLVDPFDGLLRYRIETR